MNATEDPCSDVRAALRSQAERVESVAPPLDEITQRAADFAPMARPRQRRPRLRVGLAIGLTALTAGGVAAAAIGVRWPRAADYRAADRSPELSSAVGDKQVTLDEYKAGFDRYRQCDAAAGVPLIDVAFNASTSLYTFSTTGTAADEDCYVREFYAVDIIWQTDPNRPGFIAMPSSAEIMTACRNNTPLPETKMSDEEFSALCDHLNQTTPTGG